MYEILWRKLVAAALRDPESDMGSMILALKSALEQDAEQPLEVAFRLVRFSGTTLRVSVEDIGKLIHDYNNALIVRRALEEDVRELTEKLAARRRGIRSSAPPPP